MDTSIVVPPRAAVPLFTRAQARASGWSDRDIRAKFQRVAHGLYVTPDVPVTHELLCQAVAMVLPEDAIITGRSAATLHGLALSGPNDPVEVLVSEHKYKNRGRKVRAWARKCESGEYRQWGRIRCALPVRAAFDVLARNALSFGVAHCDAMVRAGLVDRPELRSFLRGHGRYYGSRKAKLAFEHIDPRAESIPESVLRVHLNLAGMNPTPQVEVYDEDGRFVARVDLAFEGRKVAVEYDGEWHAAQEQRERDLRRRQRLRECGWTVVVVTRDELYGDVGSVVARVKQALEASRA